MVDAAMPPSGRINQESKPLSPPIDDISLQLTAMEARCHGQPGGCPPHALFLFRTTSSCQAFAGRLPARAVLSPLLTTES